LLVDDVVGEGGREPFIKRAPSSGHLEEDCADCVDITAQIRRLSQQLFGRHVLEGSGNPGHVGIAQSHIGRIVWFQEHRETEVQDLYLVLGCHENIAGLEVPMDDTALVCFLECRRDLNTQSCDIFLSQGFAAQFVRKSGSSDVFHHQKVDTRVRIEIVDRSDAGMIQL